MELGWPPLNRRDAVKILIWTLAGSDSAFLIHSTHSLWRLEVSLSFKESSRSLLLRKPPALFRPKNSGEKTKHCRKFALSQMLLSKNCPCLIALHTDSKNSLRLMRPTAWLRQTLLLTQRLCMCVYWVLSQNIDFFAYFYQDMVNNNRCSWEKCKRDSKIPEKVVWVTK